MHDLNTYRRPALYKKVDRYEVTAELAQRLKNISGRIELSLSTETASEQWLAPYLPNILSKMNQVWSKQQTGRWQNTHQRYQSARQEIRQFMLGRTHDSLDANQWWQLVQLIEQCPAADEPLQHFQQYKQAFPDDARADFMLGKYWAKENDPQAITYLETAYALPWLADQAAYLISDYYHNNNNRHKALDWQERYRQARILKDQAEEELGTLSPEDVLIAPSTLSIIEQKLALLGSVHGHPAIKEAWVAEKKINCAAASDVLVMGVITNAGFFQSAQHLETELAEKTHTYRGVHIVTDLSSKKLVSKIKHIGQQIY